MRNFLCSSCASTWLYHLFDEPVAPIRAINNANLAHSRVLQYSLTWSLTILAHMSSLPFLRTEISPFTTCPFPSCPQSICICYVSAYHNITVILLSIAAVIGQSFQIGIQTQLGTPHSKTKNKNNKQVINHSSQNLNFLKWKKLPLIYGFKSFDFTKFPPQNTIIRLCRFIEAFIYWLFLFLWWHFSYTSSTSERLASYSL